MRFVRCPKEDPCLAFVMELMDYETSFGIIDTQRDPCCVQDSQDQVDKLCSVCEVKLTLCPGRETSKPA